MLSRRLLWKGSTIQMLQTNSVWESVHWVGPSLLLGSVHTFVAALSCFTVFMRCTWKSTSSVSITVLAHPRLRA